MYLGLNKGFYTILTSVKNIRDSKYNDSFFTILDCQSNVIKGYKEPVLKCFTFSITIHC